MRSYKSTNYMDSKRTAEASFMNGLQLPALTPLQTAKKRLCHGEEFVNIPIPTEKKSGLSPKCPLRGTLKKYIVFTGEGMRTQFDSPPRQSRLPTRNLQVAHEFSGASTLPKPLNKPLPKSTNPYPPGSHIKGHDPGKYLN